MSTNLIPFPVPKQRVPEFVSLKDKVKKPADQNSEFLPIKCFAFTTKGNRCKAYPIAGEPFCHSHLDFNLSLFPSKALTDRAIMARSLTQDRICFIGMLLISFLTLMVFLLDSLIVGVAPFLSLPTLSFPASLLLSYSLLGLFSMVFLGPIKAFIGPFWLFISLVMLSVGRGKWIRSAIFILGPFVVPLLLTLYGKHSRWSAMGLFVLCNFIVALCHLYREKTLILELKSNENR